MTTSSGAKSDGSEITVTLIGGPRDGVRQLIWLPAPGGRFVGEPIWYPKTETAPPCEPPAPPISAGGLTLCR
jgi:hypothetical protein